MWIKFNFLNIFKLNKLPSLGLGNFQAYGLTIARPRTWQLPRIGLGNCQV